LQPDTPSPIFIPLLKTFAEVLCFKVGKLSLWLFLNCDGVFKSSLLCFQHGFMGMTQKQSSSLNGRAHHLCTWRRPYMFIPAWNAYFLGGIYGTVRYPLGPKGGTVNQHFSSDVLQCLQEDVWQKWPDKWHTGDWFLYHSSAVTHSALSV
jgi:hypothetical protein